MSLLELASLSLTSFTFFILPLVTTQNLLINAMVTSGKKFSVHQNFITFATFNRLKKMFFFVREFNTERTQEGIVAILR
jgi:hypothetical protein